MNKFTIISKAVTSLRNLAPYNKTEAAEFLIRAIADLSQCDEVENIGEAVFSLRDELCCDNHDNCFCAYTTLLRLEAVLT